jgi:DNA-binding response OmpR family regulator
MNTLLLTTDLMLASRVTQAARATAATVEVIGDAATLNSRVAEDHVKRVLLDLNCPGVDLGQLVRSLREASRTDLQVIAVGPHVHRTKLDAARAAGCDQVLTKGQFHRTIDQIVTEEGLDNQRPPA